MYARAYVHVCFICFCTVMLYTQIERAVRNAACGFGAGDVDLALGAGAGRLAEKPVRRGEALPAEPHSAALVRKCLSRD